MIQKPMSSSHRYSDVRYADVPNFFQMNYMDWNKQRGPHVPRPRGRPKLVPDSDVLFDVQQDLWKAHQMFRALIIPDRITPRELEELRDELARIQRHTDNAYRRQRYYLNLHGGEENDDAISMG
jgi:hypothetical protein